MTLIGALKNSAGNDRLRRKQNKGMVLVIVDGVFCYECSGDEKTSYNLTVSDVIADDWEIEVRTWTGSETTRRGKKL